jgi:hypothetical protein
LLTGKTYSTVASILNASPRDAFDGALQFTTSNGFTALSSDKNAGSISAAQTVNMRNGKNVPLTITMKADGANTTMAMSYLTPLGVISPDEAIKKHFCATVAAAAASSARILVASPSIPVEHVHAPPPTLRPIQRSAPVGYAMITAEQKEAIEAALMKNMSNERVRAMVKEAASSIIWMAEKIGCLNHDRGLSGLNELASPNFNLADYFNVRYPMTTYSAGTKYHDKSVCLSVIRFSGWKMLADNALEYQVTFKADDSGETSVITHSIIRQPDSTWTFGVKN